jgi:hypothetical protein
MRSQRALTIAAAANQNEPLANRAIETWLVLRPAGSARILLESVAILSQAGMIDAANAWGKRAREQGAPKRKIDAALNGEFDTTR